MITSFIYVPSAKHLQMFNIYKYSTFVNVQLLEHIRLEKLSKHLKHFETFINVKVFNICKC